LPLSSLCRFRRKIVQMKLRHMLCKKQGKGQLRMGDVERNKRPAAQHKRYRACRGRLINFTYSLHPQSEGGFGRGKPNTSELRGHIGSSFSTEAGAARLSQVDAHKARANRIYHKVRYLLTLGQQTAFYSGTPAVLVFTPPLPCLS
jgi:hypothetical protein